MVLLGDGGDAKRRRGVCGSGLMGESSRCVLEVDFGVEVWSGVVGFAISRAVGKAEGGG